VETGAVSWTLATVALAVLVVAAVSRRLSGGPVTPAMIFVALGLLAGPRVLGELDVSPAGAGVRTLAEATLALVLFADAARIDLRALRRDYRLPLRLLSVGLPLTIAAGAACAALVFGSLSLTGFRD
jgi:NhaP-type Na+/H+ or K+/H+ antiporter